MPHPSLKRWTSHISVGMLLFTGSYFSSHAASPQESRIEELENHLTDLEDTLRDLTSKLEELDHKIKRIGSTSTVAPTMTPAVVSAPDISPSMTSSPVVSPLKTTSGTSAPAVPVKDSPDAVARYNEAFDLLKAQQLSQALGAFQMFERIYPQSTLYGLSIYWRGVIHLIQEHYTEAIHLFDLMLQKDPRCSKRYDAFYKIAQSYKAQGQEGKACETLRICLRALETDKERPQFQEIEQQIQALLQACTGSTGHHVTQGPKV